MKYPCIHKVWLFTWYKYAREISHFSPFKWFTISFFHFIGFKSFSSTYELFSWMSLFLIDHQVSIVMRSLGFYSWVCFNFRDRICKTYTNFIKDFIAPRMKSWSLPKLWIRALISKGLGLNGRCLKQCSSRHLLGHYWILAQIHEVGSLQRLLLQIHIQSRI